jgi:hypothetical protein
MPNPPPPAGTTADMVLRGSNMSAAVMGQYEIRTCRFPASGFPTSFIVRFYDIKSNQTNFPASLLPVGVTPTTSRRIATRDLRRKWPEAQAERVASVHVFGSQKGQKPSPAACVTIR